MEAGKSYHQPLANWRINSSPKPGNQECRCPKAGENWCLSSIREKICPSSFIPSIDGLIQATLFEGNLLTQSTDLNPNVSQKYPHRYTQKYFYQLWRQPLAQSSYLKINHQGVSCIIKLKKYIHRRDWEFNNNKSIAVLGGWRFPLYYRWGNWVSHLQS